MSVSSYYKNIDKHAYHLFFKYWLSITKKIYFKKIILNWDYFMSINPNITWDIVKELQKSSSNDTGENIFIRWNYCLLSSNPNITWDIVTAHPYPGYREDIPFSNTVSDNWCYAKLSGNPNITWDIVTAHPEKPWDYSLLSKNPNITWDIVRNNPIPKVGKKWCYNRLSINPNITWEIVKENPNIPWNYGLLSKNPNITWDIVKENPYPNGEHSSNTWNYHILSRNPNITWDIVRNNPYPDGERSSNTWNINILSKNSSITWDIVKENPDKFKSYYFLSQNPNITWNIFLENLYDWDYNTLLSRIDFIDKVVVEKIKKIIYHFKNNITEELMIYVWNPTRVEKWKYLLDDEEI